VSPEATESAWETFDGIRQQLAREVPMFGYVMQHVHIEILLAARRVNQLAAHEAVQQIFNQAANDFTDLLFDLDSARGRPATRAARALVEHMVNILDVLSDDSVAQQYVDHEAVIPGLEARAAIGLNLLEGGEHRAERHRLKKLARDSKEREGKVLKQYGTAFRRSWNSENLYDRASRHGVLDSYDYYRLASAVLHGSSGGQRGTVSTVSGLTVRRLGPALGLLPPAYCEGVRAFQRILTSLRPLGLETAALDEGLEGLLRGWPFYRSAILRVDKRLWPDEPPESPVAVLAVARSGKRRWYHYDPHLGLVIEAVQPSPGALSKAQHENIENLLGQGFQDHIADEDEWLTIVVAGVNVAPIPTGRWMPAEGILIPPRSGRRLRELLRVDL
jgi:hypothetical protein